MTNTCGRHAAPLDFPDCYCMPCYAVNLVSRAAFDCVTAAMHGEPNPHSHHRVLGVEGFVRSLPLHDYVSRRAQVVLMGSRRLVRIAEGALS